MSRFASFAFTAQATDGTWIVNSFLSGFEGEQSVLDLLEEFFEHDYPRWIARYGEFTQIEISATRSSYLAYEMVEA